jgi:pimeloyl-ACP methyl ester carboxylesterase
MFATIGGRRIWYELRGNPDAEVLVMVRGLGRTSLHWGAVLDALGREFYLLLLDNRGTGRSDRVRMPFSVADLADDVAGVLDAAEIARAHVLGMSLGGMVALQFALDHGGRLDRLVLLATTAGGRRAVPPPLAPFAKMAVAALRPLRERVAIEARQVLGEGFVAKNPQLIEEWAEIAERFPMPPRTLVYQALAARLHDVHGELARVSAPTLIVSCERDALVPPENSRILARGIRNAELAWLTGEGHDLTTSHPTESVRIIRDFLLRPMAKVGAARHAPA